jgi:hypothetical protein
MIYLANPSYQRWAAKVILTKVTIMVQKVDLSAFSRDDFLILLANVRVKFVVFLVNVFFGSQ